MLRFTRRAECDLDGHYEHIKRRNVKAAANVIQRIREKCTLYAEFPEMGTQCDEVAQGLRYFVVASYVVYYRIREGDVEVIRVLHGAQDAASHFFS